MAKQICGVLLAKDLNDADHRLFQLDELSCVEIISEIRKQDFRANDYDAYIGLDNAMYQGNHLYIAFHNDVYNPENKDLRIYVFTAYYVPENIEKCVG